MLASPPFTVSVCGEFFLSLFLLPALNFPLLFPAMHREDYQPQLIYKLSDALTIEFHTLAARYNSDTVKHTVGNITVRFVGC